MKKIDIIISICLVVPAIWLNPSWVGLLIGLAGGLIFLLFMHWVHVMMEGIQ